jgi:hypothetical protein
MIAAISSAGAASGATQGRRAGLNTCGKPRKQFRAWMQRRMSKLISISVPG